MTTAKVGSVIFLRAQNGPYLAGLIPLLVGVAMLVYIYFLSRPVE